jgi:hypothetical protein
VAEDPVAVDQNIFVRLFVAFTEVAPIAAVVAVHVGCQVDSGLKLSARGWDGSSPHQGPPQAREDSYGKWDATGIYLIAYAMPHKALRLTGKKPSSLPALNKEETRR